MSSRARVGTSSRIERQITNLIRHALRDEVKPDSRMWFLIGAPDLTFRDATVAVFVDRCSWHGCPEHSTSQDGKQRQAADRKVAKELTESGWEVHRVWEHEENLGPFIDAVVSAVLRRTQEKTRWIGAHLADHDAGVWCHTCETWPHKPVPGSDGVCERCGSWCADHGEDVFAFPTARLQQARALHGRAG